MLVLLLLFVVSASALLLTSVNSSIKRSVYNPETNQVLEEAKSALISWAVNHPVNPGTLPMPDRNNDLDYNGDSDCYSGGPIGNNLLLGRLPWRYNPSPCKDSPLLSGLNLHPNITSNFDSDMTGNVLWYSAAHNLVYEYPDYPIISPGMVDMPDGWITVRDSSGTIISERVAFVVISPGPAMAPYSDCNGMSYAGQDRSGNTPDIENYLDSVTIDSITYSNADYDQDFIMYPNSLTTNSNTLLEKCDQFNDQLTFVTIDELMDKISRRVLNETTNALSAWYNTIGALPWLAPFGDPKADPMALIKLKNLTGTATATSSSLTDSTIDFDEQNITPGDVVWNISDGSRGIVTDVNLSTLTIAGGMRFGVTNSFSITDEYFIERSDVFSRLVGAADPDSTGLSLVDYSKDFKNLGLVSGDVIDNITDGTSGVINYIDNTSITVTSLGGANNTGTASLGSSGYILEDSLHDFDNMGIAAGYIIDNISDGSSGIISAVNDHQINVTSLSGGTNDTFQPGDVYLIRSDNSFQADDIFKVRSNIGEASTGSSGLILIDSTANFKRLGTQPGDIIRNLTNNTIGIVANVDSPTKLVLAEFDFGPPLTFAALDNYSISRLNSKNNTRIGLLPLYQPGEIFRTGFSFNWHSPNSAGSIVTTLWTDTTYRNALRSWAGTSSGTSGTVNVSVDDGVCAWISTGFVRCTGVYEDSNAEFLSGTATAGSSGLTLVNSSTNFSSLGVKPGDQVVNITDGTTAIIFSVISSQLTLNNIDGYSPLSMDEGDDYQIKLAAGRINFTSITPTSSYTDRLYYSDSLASSGYVNESLLEVGDTIINRAGAGSVGLIKNVNKTSNYITYSILEGPGNPDINTGDSIRIEHNFVNKRTYEFDIVLKGNAVNLNAGEVRKRIVCKGYSSNCTSPSNNATLKGDGTSAFVVIRDYENDIPVGEAKNILPATGLSSRSMKISLDYYMNTADGDLPEWFIRNKWYQYVLVSYSSSEQPLEPNCDPDDNCLTLNLRNSANTIVASRDDIRALVMISGDVLATQSWSEGYPFEYYENDHIATAGSSNSTLIDGDMDFILSGVEVGDALLNRSDGSRGIITSVLQTEIEVDSLTGGSDNVFNEGDAYTIDSLYHTDPDTSIFNKFTDPDKFNDIYRIAKSCEPDESKLCWSN